MLVAKGGTGQLGRRARSVRCHLYAPGTVGPRLRGVERLERAGVQHEGRSVVSQRGRMDVAQEPRRYGTPAQGAKRHRGVDAPRGVQVGVQHPHRRAVVVEAIFRKRIDRGPLCVRLPKRPPHELNGRTPLRRHGHGAPLPAAPQKVKVLRLDHLSQAGERVKVVVSGHRHDRNSSLFEPAEPPLERAQRLVPLVLRINNVPGQRHHVHRLLHGVGHRVRPHGVDRPRPVPRLGAGRVSPEVKVPSTQNPTRCVGHARVRNCEGKNGTPVPQNGSGQY